MNKKIKIFSLIIIVFLMICIVNKNNNLMAKDGIFSNTISNMANEKITKYEDVKSLTKLASDAGCYISAFEIKTTKDGTAKFDTDDNVGNDSNDSNGRVRTFDYINYNLEYVTAIEDTTQTIDSAYVAIEFTLDKDPSEAVLNPDTFKWCENMVTTYYYEDGTTSTTWNQNKVVTK